MPSVNQITLVRDGRLCTHGERWLTDIVRITGLGKGRGQAGADEQKIVSGLQPRPRESLVIRSDQTEASWGKHARATAMDRS